MKKQNDLNHVDFWESIAFSFGLGLIIIIGSGILGLAQFLWNINPLIFLLFSGFVIILFFTLSAVLELRYHLNKAFKEIYRLNDRITKIERED